MKNRPIPNAGNNNSGLRGLLKQLLGRRFATEPVKARIVKVWDARRDNYRDVDLNDRNDPLWPTARELYLFSKGGPRRTAA
jgi:hypothetical protein